MGALSSLPVWRAPVAGSACSSGGVKCAPESSPPTLPRLPALHSSSTRVDALGDRSALFRFVMDDDCGAAMGCGLGGTSLINAGVALRPADAVFDEERWPSGLRADREGLLRESFDRAEAMLRPAPYPEEGPRLPKLDALEAAARAMGLLNAFSRAPLTIAFTAGKSAAGVAQPACELCGDCLSGCNTGAKTTLLTTYLPDAKAHGARAVHRRSTCGSWRSATPTTSCTSSHSRLKRDRFDAAPMFVRANVVILAAGAFGRRKSCLRSRAKGLFVSRELGRRFSGNATTLAFGYDSARKVNAIGAPRGAVVGPAIAGMIDVREGERMLIQETSIPRPLATALGMILRTTRPQGGPLQRLGTLLSTVTGSAIERTQSLRSDGTRRLRAAARARRRPPSDPLARRGAAADLLDDPHEAR